MKLVLATGDEIEIIGPVLKNTRDGIFISHHEFNANINGTSVVISSDDLDGAEFPEDFDDEVIKSFDDTLPDVLSNWKKMCRLYAKFKK
ncbi:hypothetical protein [Nisaea nitritireducens]|uniref:hypothetical protein n=1 Tax=Nisaea nitritireducens TaxID=568392 RepID=UPI0018679928|nr:hypothetical protein [Nisaea nitritireducens]